MLNLFNKFWTPGWSLYRRIVAGILSLGKKEENCSLPLMTPSNNISEVRRGLYLPLPWRPTWKNRPNSGMSSARCGLRPQNLYSLIARAACVHTRRRWRPVWNTARVLLRRESLYSVLSLPTLSSSLSLSLPLSLFSVPIILSYPPTRVTRRMVSADSKGRPRRMLSLDQCVHLNWMSIRDLISKLSNIVRVSVAVTNFPRLIFFSEYFEWAFWWARKWKWSSRK